MCMREEGIIAATYDKLRAPVYPPPSLSFRVIAELSAKAGVDGSSPESMEVNGQGEGSQTIPGGSPVGAASSSSSSSAIQQLQMAAPLTGEQLQAVCITTQDFKVSGTVGLYGLRYWIWE